jgi:hypothetical protein
VGLSVRKSIGHREVVSSENGQRVDGLVIAWFAVVIENPFPAEYVADLVTLADAVGEELGDLVGPPCVDLLDAEVEAFGKAALVGIDGEVEHGSALIHNLRFGNRFRQAAGGDTLLPAAEKVGLPGQTIDVPVKHKLDATTRSHHQTVTIVVPDSPRPREIVVAAVAVSGGRPLARLATFGAEVA